MLAAPASLIGTLSVARTRSSRSKSYDQSHATDAGYLDGQPAWGSTVEGMPALRAKGADLVAPLLPPPCAPARTLRTILANGLSRFHRRMMGT